MKQRPILFSAPMVQAILAGRKTQTRRVVKADEFEEDHSEDSKGCCISAGWLPGSCRFGRAGDRLWIKEPFLPEYPDRILLEITGIRAQRLQEISEADAVAEGAIAEACDHARRTCAEIGCCGSTAKGEFQSLWESINGADSWAANPWVWVVEFKVVQSDLITS